MLNDKAQLAVLVADLSVALATSVTACVDADVKCGFKAFEQTVEVQHTCAQARIWVVEVFDAKFIGSARHYL